MKTGSTVLITSRTYALSIIFCLLFTIVMFGANFERYTMPYHLFITLLIICAIISVLSYAGYIYGKIRSWKRNGYNILYNLISFFLLGLLVLLIIGFPVLVLSHER